MDAAWLAPLMEAAAFASLVAALTVCLRCRNKRPPVSIRQTDATEESTPFRILHPSQQTVGRSSAHPPPSCLLSPYSPSADPGTQRRHQSFTSQTESNLSYENPADGPSYVNNESDVDDPGYIIVLPDGEAPPSNQSRASTPSSDVLHDYENVPEKKAPPDSPSGRHSPAQLSADGDEDEREYLNVDPSVFHGFPSGSTPDLSADSDSDDDGNYVNVHDVTLTA